MLITAQFSQSAKQRKICWLWTRKNRAQKRTMHIPGCVRFAQGDCITLQWCKSPQGEVRWRDVTLKSPRFFWGEVKWVWNRLNFSDVKWGDYQITSIFSEVRWGDFEITSILVGWGEVTLKSPQFWWDEVRWLSNHLNFAGVRWGDFWITPIISGVR